MAVRNGMTEHESRHGLVGGFVLWRVLIQSGNKLLGARWHRDRAVQDDILGWKSLAVQVSIGIVVRPERGTFQGDASEQAAGTRIAQNLRAHGGVRCSSSFAPHGTCCSRGIGAQLDL